MYEIPMDLCELSQDVIWQHVNINMGSLTMMCWLVLPQMIQRRRGAIVNLSSSSSVGPLPYMNIYSASKVISLQDFHKSNSALIAFFFCCRFTLIIFLVHCRTKYAIQASLFKLSSLFTWQLT